MNLDYQIASDYLNKLPTNLKEELCKSVLDGLKAKKKTKKELEQEYTSFLRTSKSFKDFKEKHMIKK